MAVSILFLWNSLVPSFINLFGKLFSRKSTDPLGSGVWEFTLPPSYSPPSTVGRKPWPSMIFWGGGAQAHKSSKNFKQPKNREDSSDLDKNLTESIATMKTIISKIFFLAVFAQKPRENFAKPSSAGSVACAERRKFKAY